MSVQRVPGGVVHKLPADLRESLIDNATALAAWKDITPLARNEFICWVEDAKRQETRERRIRRTREELEEGCVVPAAGPAAATATARAASPEGGIAMQKIVPNLWFDTEAEEAASFYVSVFEDARILHVSHYGEAGPREAGLVMTVEWELEGQRFIGINGGPRFKFDEAVSFQIECKDQDEVDYFWEKLTAEGGEPGQCGWLTDKFGLSWQVVPAGFEEIVTGSDPERAQRAMAAMLKMGKLDVAALRAAADGTS